MKKMLMLAAALAFALPAAAPVAARGRTAHHDTRQCRNAFGASVSCNTPNAIPIQGGAHANRHQPRIRRLANGRCINAGHHHVPCPH